MSDFYGRQYSILLDTINSYVDGNLNLKSFIQTAEALTSLEELNYFRKAVSKELFSLEQVYASTLEQQEISNANKQLVENNVLKIKEKVVAELNILKSKEAEP